MVPKFLAPADPASRWTCAHGGQAFYAYSTNYLIDLDHAVILDVEASTAIRQAEVTACKRMIARVQDRFGIWPQRLAADTGYGSAEMLAWLVHERDIEPHIPVFDKSARRDGTFEHTDFRYDIARDVYTCPTGEELRRHWQEGRAAKEHHRSTASTDTAPARRRATPAACGHDAAPTARTARSCTPSMRAPATSPRPTPMSRHDANERRSKCCSRTSNAS